MMVSAGPAPECILGKSLPRAGAIAREVKFAGEPIAAATDNGVFEGYASLFGQPDLGRDVVVPGAFAAALKRRGVAGIRMLWQHDPAEPVGRWLRIEEDARGLRVRGKLNLAVERAREIHALTKEGAVDGLSIGYRVERARPDRAGGVRRLESLDLWEISLVTFPMLPGARVSAVKREACLIPGAARPARALAAAIRRAARRLSARSTTRNP